MVYCFPRCLDFLAFLHTVHTYICSFFLCVIGALIIALGIDNDACDAPAGVMYVMCGGNNAEDSFS